MAKKKSGRTDGLTDKPVSLFRKLLTRQEKRTTSSEIETSRDRRIRWCTLILMDAWFLHKQYFSPACWQTVEEATRIYPELTTKKENLNV